VSYNPSEYWHERGKKYKENFRYDKSKRLQEEFLITHLNGISGSFKSVLELGCGFGRITQLLLTNYSNITEYLAVDISPHQIENAKTLLSSTKLTSQVKLDFLVSDIQSLKLDKEYDLVILSEVLLHILPTEIDSIIKKLIALSKKHIINIDWYAEHPPRIQARHNFIHQYEALYKKYTEPSTIIKRIPIKRKKKFP
jgi:SAM-dependent methyltransferase